MPGSLESRVRAVYGSYVLRLHGLLQVCAGAFDGALLVGRNLVAVLLEILLGLEYHSVTVVYLVYALLGLLVRSLIGLGLVTHPLDFLLAQAARSGDADVLRLACSLVGSGYVQYAVRVDVEAHLDLRDSARCRSDAVEIELADKFVVLSHRPLALKHADLYGRLVVSCRGEYLTLLRRDGGVRVDELGHNAAEGLDAERKRSYIQKEDILHVARKHAALDGRADSHYLVRVHALVRLLAEEVPDDFLNFRDTGGTADEQNLVYVGSFQVSILEGLAARLDGAVEEAVAEHLELSSGEGLHKMLRNAVHRHYVRQVDLCGSLVRELNLSLLGSFLKSLERHRILLEVDSVVLGSEFGSEPVDDRLVEIIAAEVGVTVRGADFEHTVSEFQDGDIESTAAEVEHRDLRILVFFVQTIGECRRGRLVYDSLHVQARDLAGLLGGLTLAVGEVRRHRDDGFGDFLTEIVFSRLLHLLEDDGRNLLRSIRMAVDIHARSVVLTLYDLIRDSFDLLGDLIVGLAHKALYRIDGIVRVGDGLTLGGVADLSLSAVREGDYGRSSPFTFVIDDDRRLVTFHYCYAGVSCTEVNSDDFSHNCISFLLIVCIVRARSRRSTPGHTTNVVPRAISANLS